MRDDAACQSGAEAKVLEGQKKNTQEQRSHQAILKANVFFRNLSTFRQSE